MKLTEKQRYVLSVFWFVPSDTVSLERFMAAMNRWYQVSGYALEASPDTIRKQLERLAERGLVVKDNGGYRLSAAGREALS